MENKKRALVTGGSRGIGKAVSLRLAADGYHVLINYRSRHEEAQSTLDEIVAAGGSGELSQFDVADRKATTKACNTILETGSIDTLVLCAGIHDDELLVFMSEEQWDTVLDVNLKSFFSVVKPFVKEMMLNRSGRIIVISSTSGESGLSGQVNYSASKAGLIGAAKSLSLECAKRGVLVNTITPGFIETEMIDEVEKKRIEHVPLGRAGKPSEVAALVSFLASDDASYITGQVIGVNGGVYL